MAKETKDCYLYLCAYIIDGKKYLSHLLSHLEKSMKPFPHFLNYQKREERALSLYLRYHYDACITQRSAWVSLLASALDSCFLLSLSLRGDGED